jgi:hypothetical protein
MDCTSLVALRLLFQIALKAGIDNNRTKPLRFAASMAERVGSNKISQSEVG